MSRDAMSMNAGETVRVDFSNARLKDSPSSPLLGFRRDFERPLSEIT
jgi:hypothetical protein